MTESTTDDHHPSVQAVKNKAQQLHDALIGSKEFLDHFLDEVGKARDAGGTHASEVAHQIAHLLRPQQAETTTG